MGDYYYNGQGTDVDHAEATKWFKDVADNHSVGNATHSLVFMYLNGEGVAKSEQATMKYSHIAAEKGIIQAQRIIAKEYISEKHFKQNYESARMWMEKATEQGDLEAQFTLGRYYMSVFGFDSDQKAFEWFMKAAEQEYLEAEYVVGGCYLHNIHVDTDFKKANEWFEIAAEHGEVQAMYELGINYLEGIGTTRNAALGIKYLTQAAAAGHAPAYKELADKYYLGIDNYDGQAKYTNPTEAHKYAMMAVQDENDGAAQFRLATILHFSFGNPTSAKEWYARAAKNEHTEAKLELSKIYIQQQENLPEAFNMLLKEIKLENIDKDKFLEAQYWTSVCLENGWGCPKDKKLAKKLYKMAVDNGFVDPAQPKRSCSVFSKLNTSGGIYDLPLLKKRNKSKYRILP